MKQTLRQRFTRFLMLNAAAAIYAAGIALFLDPNLLVTGGLSGIAIMLSRFLPLDTGMIVLILNIPLLIVGTIVFGRQFLLSTVYATVVSSVWISLFGRWFAPVLPFTDNLFIEALLGGCILSFGLALVFLSGGTTGGTDIIAKLLRRRFRHLSTGRFLMISDVVIVIASAIVFREIEPALYSAIAIVIGDMLFDKVLYGFDEAKLIYIISEKESAIRARILNDLEAGVTILEGKGGFTGDEKKVLLVAVKKPMFPRVKDIVREEDATAFMIVTSATEVFGEGFKTTSRGAEL